MIFTAPYSIVETDNFALRFHPDHLADLRASGLSDETIRQSGVYSLRLKDFTLFFNARKNLLSLETALCLPYQDGEFARIKLFPFPSVFDSRGKPMKYSQPPNTSARLYIPFPVTDGDVCLCEGEKKTLAAYQAGLNAVGIGGVWSWLSGGEPIDDLKLIEWDGRDVTIIPDSDVFRRVNLLRAIYALGRELRALGANVYIGQIPECDSNKVGLDDYLLAGGEVATLDLFRLDHGKFKSLDYWHREWKFKKAVSSLEAAA
jgi:hypothetical protein